MYRLQLLVVLVSLCACNASKTGALRPSPVAQVPTVPTVSTVPNQGRQRLLQSTCTSDSFTVTSIQIIGAGGCYQATGNLFEYSTGTSDYAVGDYIVIPTIGNEAWHVGLLTGIESQTTVETLYSFEYFCQSLESPVFAHPADATWFCFDHTSDTLLEQVDESNFSIACGCGSTTPTPDVPAPTPAPTPEPTPAPITPATPEPTPAPITPATPEPTPAPITPATPEPTPAPITPATPEPTLAPVTPATPGPTPAPITPETPGPTPAPVTPTIEPTEAPVTPASPAPVPAPTPGPVALTETPAPVLSRGGIDIPTSGPSSALTPAPFTPLVLLPPAHSPTAEPVQPVAPTPGPTEAPLPSGIAPSEVPAAAGVPVTTDPASPESPSGTASGVSAAVGGRRLLWSGCFCYGVVGAVMMAVSVACEVM